MFSTIKKVYASGLLLFQELKKSMTRRIHSKHQSLKTHNRYLHTRYNGALYEQIQWLCFSMQVRYLHAKVLTLCSRCKTTTQKFNVEHTQNSYVLFKLVQKEKRFLLSSRLKSTCQHQIGAYLRSLQYYLLRMIDIAQEVTVKKKRF